VKPSLKCRITCNGQSKEVEIQEGEGFLEAAMKAEMDPPYSCLEGICGTCEAVLEEGQAEEFSEKVQGPQVIKTCVSRPKSDTVINYDKR
jgi:ferredoxin